MLVLYLTGMKIKYFVIVTSRFLFWRVFMSAKICKSFKEKVWVKRFAGRGPRPKEQGGNYVGSKFAGWKTLPSN